SLEPMFGSATAAGIVLGIDPGVSRCGYGAVAAEGSALTAVACGIIRTPPGDPLPDRLAALQIELEGLLSELRPAAVAVERVFFQANVRTAMSVGQASGLALALAARAGVPVCQYTPNEVKQAVAGYGAAGKAQVQAMVARLLHLPEVPKPPDAADALALAICHLSAGRFRAAAGAAGTTGAAGPAGFTVPGPVPALARAIAAATHHERPGARRGGAQP
ncbi:MAG TPA: crossover junction endodeoxyribonuclease RuvC, partial [Acidimicrobiia bacterium]|nr:crossover junction endodeoxyribonuclease RuvC [Acidimicrobiia bacterium]